MKCEILSLGEVCNITSSKRIFAKEYQTHGIPFYRGKEIIEKSKGNKVSTELFISEDRFSEIRRKYETPQKGDILLTSVGTLGVPWLVDETDFYFKDGNLTWLRSSERLLNKYLYLWLNSLEAQVQIDTMCIGSTQKALTIDTLKKFRISLPSMLDQQKICNIIYPMMKKIELNSKINENLQQQAQELFKSWFIDFEPFGGCAPVGMQLIPLQELCTVVTKGTTPTTLGKRFTTSGINFIKAESILNNHSIDVNKLSFIDDETHSLLKRSVIQSGDIVFTIAGTLGRFALIDDSVLPANTNQAVAIVRANREKITPEYLYSVFLGNWHNDYYSKRIQQAVQANLSLSTIKSLPIPVLEKDAMSEYLSLISPIISMSKAREIENAKLASLRDLLLPKIMSGEIDVSNIQI